MSPSDRAIHSAGGGGKSKVDIIIRILSFISERAKNIALRDIPAHQSEEVEHMTASREVQPDSFMDSPPTSPTPETEYLPESDGKPMAETDVHRTQMIELLECLAEYYRADPRVYVTGNIFLYFRNHEGERQSISPDIFVVRGVEKKLRRIYNLDVEKKAPDVVLELTSRHTKVEDLGNKRVIYADLGVSEYFLFDPLDGTLTPQLRGFRLQGGEYIPMVGTRLASEVLGLDLVVEDDQLRLYNPHTAERLRTHAEAEAARREAEAARREAEAARQEAEAARQEAEAENTRLREELARLRAGQG